LKNGGAGLLKQYGNSPSKLIMTVYSDYQWKRDFFETQLPRLLRT